MEYVALLFNEKDGDENSSKACILKYFCTTIEKRAFHCCFRDQVIMIEKKHNFFLISAYLKMF